MNIDWKLMRIVIGLGAAGLLAASSESIAPVVIRAAAKIYMFYFNLF